jgi:hypothetical protein
VLAERGDKVFPLGGWSLLAFNHGPYGLMPTDATARASQNSWRLAMSWDALTEYLVDAFQRNVLMLDVLRRRGNNYLEYMASDVPHALGFAFEPVLDGRTLPCPVNYGLERILPPEGVVIDETARPFIVVDPRAGHGPGIGGMKSDSEIGVTLAAGHPCYFVGFLPNPVKGQTIEDVGRAQASFIDTVAKRHPAYSGKPCVIGNCQAGWAILGLAAIRPDLPGPVMAVGAPLSYWNGRDGLNTMRYVGGMLGGTWLVSLASDIGDGIFDGAYLVQTFENLNPANTYWSKLYNVWSKIDTERERFLSFEKWWGGHALLNREEIEFITEGLFVGNKLTTGGIRLSTGEAVDLQHVRSPIVVFCSWGDNICPPPQALGWVPEIYATEDDLIAHDQTIVYCVHPEAGHLGVFVSSAVARKEHSEFTENMDLIDVLPPGLWEAVITSLPAGDEHRDLILGQYVARFEARTLDDIRALGLNSVEEDRRFATVARLGEINAQLYKSWIRPFVQATANAPAAEWLRQLHPLRLQFELFSDTNPLMRGVGVWAELFAANRRPARADNPFLAWQAAVSSTIETSLDLFRIVRDSAIEVTFKAFYGWPPLQAVLGIDDATVMQPRQEVVQREAYCEVCRARLRRQINEVTPETAALRALLFILAAEKAVDERTGNALRNLSRLRALHKPPIGDIKRHVREQDALLRFDMEKAMATATAVLREVGTGSLLDDIQRVVTAAGPLEGETLTRFERLQLMLIGAENPEKPAAPSEPAALTRRAPDAA